MTLNARGLSDSKKVRHLVNSCYKSCSKASENIFMFQETYVPQLTILDYIWRGEYHLTPGLGNSVGCITLLSAPLKIVHRVELGTRGHILAIMRENATRADYILVNVYAPNGLDSTKTEFFDEVLQKAGEVQSLYDCMTLILAGDLNIVFTEDEVKNRIFSSVEKRIAEGIKTGFDSLNLVDGWSKSDSKSFTWTTTRNGKQAFSILDRILFTEDKLRLRSKVTDWSLSISDHAAVTALFDQQSHTSNNKSFIPRLDPGILTDPDCVGEMNEIYSEMMSNAIDDWDPHTKLEYCKLCIRTAANQATGKMKARYRDEEKVLNDDINMVVSELTSLSESSPDYDTYIHKLDDLRMLKRQFVTKIGTKLERRTASKWYNEGELSNKYFFNLLNRRSNEEVSSIIINNEVCNEQGKIEEEVARFYRDLYENLPSNLTTNDDFFRNLDSVEPQGAEAVTREVTLEELSDTLKGCADSAPGPDGIPYSFLRHHWSSFGPLLLESWHYSLRINKLPHSHKVSYLRLIPKVGKDTRVISNL